MLERPHNSVLFKELQSWLARKRVINVNSPPSPISVHLSSVALGIVLERDSRERERERPLHSNLE